MRFKISLAIILLLVTLGAVYVFKPTKYTLGPSVERSEIFEGAGYEAVDPNAYEVSIFAENFFSPTRIKITPDGKHLLVSQINGEVLAFNREGDDWSKTPYLVTKVETMFPGFPPDEAGLVGMTFSQDFSKNKKLFLLYTFKDSEGKIQNRISTATLWNIFGKLRSPKPKLIWQANIPGAGSHQIADAIAVTVGGKARILFLIGEGFDGKKAQDPTLHAGKLMSIDENGNDPIVHALGIRNGFALAKNPFDIENRILISDTGPDKYDRLIYTNPLLPGQLNFNWNGEQEKLAESVPDPNFEKVSDMVILRLTPTKTFTGLSFTKTGELFATFFGPTGTKETSPGKEVVKGKIDNLDGQPSIVFETIIKRASPANGKFGNPIGLEIDPESGDFFFADILEGRIYQVKVKGGDS